MKIWEYQFWHILILAILLLVLYFLCSADASFLEGSFWNISAKSWFVAAVLVPIIHQLYVLIFWRSELHYKGVSKLFGKNAFIIYKIGFAVLILSRPVLITLLAFANAYTISINPVVTYLLSIILLIPAIYLFYSVKTYFGIDRAMGIDHFHPEKYKNVPFIKKGIFKYTNNGMYIYGFFVLWLPGILLQSKAALLLALFNHIYIWIHYYFTELPDIKIIYNKTEI